MIFMVFQKPATESMMEFISTTYEVPNILSSPDYIRNRVMALVERDMMKGAALVAEQIDEDTLEVLEQAADDFEPQ